MNAAAGVTVRLPLTLRRRGGRKIVIGPTAVGGVNTAAEPNKAQPIREDPAVRALALGFYWRKLIETGECSSIAAVARSERVSAPYVGRLLRITLRDAKEMAAHVLGLPP